MKDNIYDLNSERIERVSRNYSEVGRFHDRCRQFLRVAVNLGYTDKLIDKLRDKDTKDVIVSGDTPYSEETHERELMIELSNVIQRRCRSIIDSAKECEEKGKDKSIYSLSSDLDLLSSNLSSLAGQKSRLSDYIQDWSRLNTKTYMHKRILEGVRFYLNELQKNIALNKEDREVLKQHGIDYRYRLSGSNNCRNRKINLHYHINDVNMKVFMCNDDGIIDEESSFIVPYGKMADGTAYPVHIRITYTMDDIIKVVTNYYQDRIENGNDSDFTITNISQVGHYGTPFKTVAVCNALSNKGMNIRFPFIDRWGPSGSQPCFGEMDGMLYGALRRMNFVDYGTLLRSWVSNFRVGYTNPYVQPNRLYAGVPKKYGQLAENLGQNTADCRRTFINSTKDCINVECVLMKGGYKDGPRCDQYTMLVQNEKKAEKDNEAKQLEEERTRQLAQEMAIEMHGNNDTGEWHEDEEFARGPLGETDF